MRCTCATDHFLHWDKRDVITVWVKRDDSRSSGLSITVHDEIKTSWVPIEITIGVNLGWIPRLNASSVTFDGLCQPDVALALYGVEKTTPCVQVVVYDVFSSRCAWCNRVGVPIFIQVP